MTQYLLFCNKRPKTSADLQEGIKSDIRPQDMVLGRTAVEKYLSKQVREDGNNFPNPLAVKILPNTQV